MFKYFLVPVLLGLCAGQTHDYSTQVYNYVHLLERHYFFNTTSVVDFIPVRNISRPLNITIDMKLFAINDFDEVGGSMELAGALYMSWFDEVTNGSGFIDTNKPTFLVPNNKIWTPRLVLTNAIDDVSAVGDPAYMCRYNMLTQEVQWSVRVLIRGACSPDVTYYPFDRQSCVFTYVPWAYRDDEILLLSGSSIWDLLEYESNGVWEVLETGASASSVNSVSTLKLSLTVERKHLYFAFNIILPILVLCVLNTIVFWLPAESGERVGFSVTCFLSFVVLLNMVMDILPRSSSPISYLCYYLVVMMIFSGLVSVVVIFEMIIYHKPETSEVPQWLQKFVRIMTCRCCKCRSNNVSDVSSGEAGEVKDEDAGSGTKTINVAPAEEDGNVGEAEDLDDEITWPIVGRVLDRMFFVAFLGVEIFFTLLFIIPLANRV